MTVTIYHNPRCSKSRASLAIIEDQQVKPEIVKYLESPPDADELKRLLALLGISARELIRTGEEVYQSLGLADSSHSDEELVEIMVANPILIQRPIVVSGDKAVIGRPPEKILEIL